MSSTSGVVVGHEEDNILQDRRNVELYVIYLTKNVSCRGMFIQFV